VIGFRGFKGEAPNNTTTGPADYWTSTPSSTEGKTSTFMVYTTNGSDRFSDFGRAYGFFIRAVREIQALPVAPTIP
jgi:hypothetical protein